MLACLPAAGQTTRRAPTKAAGGWTFEVAPYLWLPALDGDISVHGRTAEVDASIGEFVETLFENFQFVTIGRMEARRGPFVFTLDLLYLSLEDEDTTSVGLQTEVDFSQLIVEFGAGYQLFDWQLGRRRWPRLSAEILVGGRYVNLDTELEITNTGPLGSRVNIDQSADWLEPFVGGRLRFAVSRPLAFVVRGDAGGFGVGSDLTWDLVATIQYQTSPKITLAAGYRLLDIDYDHGSGTDKFVYDVLTHGPIFSVAFRF
jgi:hypothetical protein